MKNPDVLVVIEKFTRPLFTWKFLFHDVPAYPAEPNEGDARVTTSGTEEPPTVDPAGGGDLTV